MGTALSLSIITLKVPHLNFFVKALLCAFSSWRMGLGLFLCRPFTRPALWGKGTFRFDISNLPALPQASARG